MLSLEGGLLGRIAASVERYHLFGATAKVRQVGPATGFLAIEGVARCLRADQAATVQHRGEAARGVGAAAEAEETDTVALDVVLRDVLVGALQIPGDPVAGRPADQPEEPGVGELDDLRQHRAQIAGAGQELVRAQPEVDIALVHRDALGADPVPVLGVLIRGVLEPVAQTIDVGLDVEKVIPGAIDAEHDPASADGAIR